MASQESIVTAAGKKHGVPPNLLWGVYGVETSHGSNISTSSAGAKGAFQFIESTAHSYGYPYTNAHDEKTFTAQADVAAKYLSDLYREHGSWDAAIKAYSGGGYGYQQAKAQGKMSSKGSTLFSDVFGFELFPGETEWDKKAQAAVGNPPSPGEVVSGVESVVTGLTNTVDSTGKFLKAITEPETWLRVAEGVGGMVLLAMGLKTLTRGSGTAGPLAEGARQARSATGVARKAAAVVK
jgi:hypothetical protein